MPYSRLFCHLVWATRGREPLIGEAEAAIIRRSLRSTIDGLGVVPHAVGFMPDHVHVALSFPPKLAVAELVRRLKGASAHAVNETRNRDNDPRFGWQAEYGAVSFGERSLADVIEYIRNQREHHSSVRLRPTFERIDEEESAEADLSE